MADKSPFHISARGSKFSKYHLEQLGDRASDARRAMDDVQDIFRRAEAERLASGGRGRWPKLAASTKDKKAQLGQDPRLLYVSGALWRSLTKEHDPNQIADASPAAMRFGTKVHYARFHDRGEGVPKRKLIALTPAECTQVSALLSHFIATGEQH